MLIHKIADIVEEYWKTVCLNADIFFGLQV